MNKNIAIVGGGTAGITVAAQLLRKNKDLSVTVFEPADSHYYQSLYTLVGAGVDKKENAARKMADVMPPGVRWVQQRVLSFSPEKNTLLTADGQNHAYDYLVIAAGLQSDWESVQGLKDTLGQNGVCSVYGHQEAEDTWRTFTDFNGGNALFSMPDAPGRRGAAAPEIVYLADAFFRETCVRHRAELRLLSAAGKTAGPSGFAEAVAKLNKDKNIGSFFYHSLIKVDGSAQKAYFEVREMQDGILENIGTRVFSFDFLHVSPPQSAPGFIRNSPLAIANGLLKGWLDVDPFMLRHKLFPNVFGLGDCAGLPTAKTAAAIQKQAPVVSDQIVRLCEGKPIDFKKIYDGYSASSVFTDYDHLLLDESVYGDKPKASFFFASDKPRYSAYLIKHYYSPWSYWNQMLKGKN